jgi:ubiquinone/menaquinone biosynthesis C-methylase UbiE
MEISQAADLLRDAGPFPAGMRTWADLGCGSGLFTYALSTLLPDGSLIYAVDKAAVTLQYGPFPVGISVIVRQEDFTRGLNGLGELDGILMANALHYVKEQPAFIRRMQSRLKENGVFLIVEYDTDQPNPWVPYPLSFTRLGQLFSGAGYRHIRKLGRKPSIFGSAEIYSALIQPLRKVPV